MTVEKFFVTWVLFTLVLAMIAGIVLVFTDPTISRELSAIILLMTCSFLLTLAKWIIHG